MKTFEVMAVAIASGDISDACISAALDSYQEASQGHTEIRHSHTTTRAGSEEGACQRIQRLHTAIIAHP